MTVERRFGAEPSATTTGRTNGRIFLRGNLFSERRDNGTSLTYNRTYFRQLSGGGDLSDTSAGNFQLRAFIESQVYDQSFTAVAADRNSESLSRLQRVPSQARGADRFWTRVFGGHAVDASVELREVRGFSDEVGYFGGRPTSTLGSGGTERTVSFFAQDIWRAADKLTINFGARFDGWKNVDAHAATRTLSTNAVADVIFPGPEPKRLQPAGRRSLSGHQKCFRLRLIFAIVSCSDAK